MKIRATIRIGPLSQKHLSAIYGALEPEVKKQTTSRSNTHLTAEGRFLVLETSAGDTAALRATLNACLRWINAMTNTLMVLERNGQQPLPKTAYPMA
jgi:tRNA threonylcarbamoyladenosine modification (KEOPS) complex  Pcc1 subunit